MAKGKTFPLFAVYVPVSAAESASNPMNFHETFRKVEKALLGQ